MKIIEPTVGRIVHFFRMPGRVEQAAIVTGVHDTRTIAVMVMPVGQPPLPITSVTLVQEGDDLPSDMHCRWMPYQLQTRPEPAAT